MGADEKKQARRGSTPAQVELGKKKTWTRQRTGTPRSRSGCITCKIRHTKCDEARPFCLRCTKSGFQCDGYGAPPPAEKKKLPAPLELAITSYALPFRVPGSQEDRRMLHYFCVQAAEDLAGYMSPDFWNKIVLQRSHDEQVVRQAVIALSSVHLENATSSPEETNAALLGASEEIMLQYNKSLRCLRKYLNHANTKEQDQPSLVVILICCALFYSFESARGNSEAAMQHLRMGLAILNDKENRDKMSHTAQDLEDMFKLEDLFHRLDLQASMYNYDRTPLLDLASPEEKLGLVSCIGSNPYQNLDEAHSELSKLQNWLLHLIIPNDEYKFYPVERLPPFIVQQKRVLLRQFTLWHEKFEAFLDAGDDGQQLGHASPGSTSSSDSTSDLRSHPSALLALIHYNNACLFLAGSLPYDPVVFGATLDVNPHRDKIEAILNDSETVLRASQSQQSSEAQSPPGVSSTPKPFKRRVISAETGVIAPLLFLAFKSGDPAVARRAQQLLETSERKEGLYDARLSAVIAKTMLEMDKENEQALLGVDPGLAPQSIEWKHVDVLDPVVGVDAIAKKLGVK